MNAKNVPTTLAGTVTDCLWHCLWHCPWHWLGSHRLMLFAQAAHRRVRRA